VEVSIYVQKQKMTGAIMAGDSGRTIRRISGPVASIGALAFSAFLVHSTPASSQAVGGVVVDLSVLNGDAAPASVSPLGAATAGGLRVPPAGAVRSRLYVAPKSAPKTRMSAKPAAQPAPKPMPKPAVQAVATPAPKPKPKPMAAPAATQAPKQLAQPAPKPAAPAPAKAAPAPPPMPATAKAPPPPPAPAPVKAPPPMPKAAEAPPAPAPAPTQQAAAPANIDLKPGQALRIVFEESATKLPAEVEANLGQLAATIRDSKDYRVQLMAYAGAKDLSTSKARRISLSRALAVRSFLIDKGVRSTQIDVRALGSKTAEKPTNRVDVNLAQR
jgi:outer membrane protein OmpA-like peptidoglycan-associated protein